MSLASKVDAILGQADAVTAFTVATTCRTCNGPLTVNKVSQTRQHRRADLTCSACSEQWTLTVTLTRPETANRRPSGDGPRLPWAPLARRLPTNQNDAAARLGIPVQTARRYRTDGVPADEADQLAVAAGLHPAHVWGTAFYVATGLNSGAVA